MEKKCFQKKFFEMITIYCNFINSKPIHQVAKFDKNNWSMFFKVKDPQISTRTMPDACAEFRNYVIKQKSSIEVTFL